MEVIEEPFEDASEQDARGYYDYFYSGVIYRFVFSNREFHARCYDDRRGEGHFLAIAAAPGGERRLFQMIPYDDVEFRTAAVYLRDTVGADTVNVLLPGGYFPLDFSRFPGIPLTDAGAGESIRCLQCRAPIPVGKDTCPKCGWTWKESSAEHV